MTVCGGDREMKGCQIFYKSLGTFATEVNNKIRVNDFYLNNN